MFTDGITETYNGVRFFGTESVAQMIREAAGAGSVEPIARRIVDTAREFAGGYFHDDCCLLAIRRSPDQSEEAETDLPVQRRAPSSRDGRS